MIAVSHKFLGPLPFKPPQTTPKRPSALSKNSESFPSPQTLQSTAVSLFIEQLGARLERLATPPPPGFPPGPPGDVAFDLLKDPLGFLEQTQRQYGDAVGLSLGGERAVLITDPNLAKTVLVDDSAIYVKTGTAFFPGSSLAGNGLLVSDGDVWRRQRQLSNPAFRRAAIERYATSMIECTSETLFDNYKWRSGVIRDVYADFNELTLKITLKALFGSSLTEASSTEEVIESIRLAFEYFTKRSASAFTIPENIPTPDNLQFSAAVARLDTAVFSLINRRRQDLAENLIKTTKENDLLTALLVSKDESGVGMDDKSLRDELMTLLVAGQETSAILLGWTCAFLSINPEIQSKAAEEVENVLQGRKPQPSDAQGALVYLEAVVLETLRVMPPAYLVGRCTSESTTLGDYDLPQGTTVLVSPYVLHRDARWWGEGSEEFDPERWLENSNLITNSDSPEDGEAKKKPIAISALAGMGPNGAYIPFGAGQRVCIGTGFAMMEAILVLAAILQRFELKPVPGTGFVLPEAEPRITNRPKRVRLQLKKRPSQSAQKNNGNEFDTDTVPLNI